MIRIFGCFLALVGTFAVAQSAHAILFVARGNFRQIDPQTGALILERAVEPASAPIPIAAIRFVQNDLGLRKIQFFNSRFVTETAFGFEEDQALEIGPKLQAMIQASEAYVILAAPDRTQLPPFAGLEYLENVRYPNGRIASLEGTRTLYPGIESLDLQGRGFWERHYDDAPTTKAGRWIGGKLYDWLH